MIKNFVKHRVTSVFGLGCIVLGAWVLHVHWVPTQTLYFNIVYVEPPALALICCGIIGLYAADSNKLK
jgi:hypothetical protein